MVKKFFLIAGLFVVAGALYYGVPFYRAIKPAFFSAEDITKNIPEPVGNSREDVPETPSGDGSAETPPPALKFADESKALGLSLPPDFALRIYAKDLVAPRVMAFDPKGVLYTSVTSQGRIVAVLDADGDGYGETRKTVLTGLRKPHGMVFYGEHFYVAEEHRIMQYRYDAETSSFIDAKGVKIADLPSDGGGHFTRTLLISDIGGRDELYVSVGSSCNVCHEEDSRRAAVIVMNVDGTNSRIFARGLRNAVFIAERPDGTGLAVTEMGRDWLGDSLPPEEVNFLSREGENFGWPSCYGAKINDRNFDTNIYIRDPCADTEAPVLTMPAHSAPLGLTFLDTRWGTEYEGDLFVSQHGSWNSSEPVGYKVVRFDFVDGAYIPVQKDFITGWLRDGAAVGRPADIVLDPNGGGVFISDDKAGVIYRVSEK